MAERNEVRHRSKTAWYVDLLDYFGGEGKETEITIKGLGALRSLDIIIARHCR
jgi:hypothetical protein